MSEELKPCPFCGSKATYTDGEAPNGETIYFIGCHQPGCIAYIHENQNYFYCLEYAIWLWNRRADDGDI